MGEETMNKRIHRVLSSAVRSPDSVKTPAHCRLIEEVERYLRRHPCERERLAPLLDQLDASWDPFDRRTFPGHVTASGIALEGASILLILHPFLKKWLQPGGHVEPGETPLQAARREVLEETGMQSEVHPWHEENRMPLDIDVHRIPANPKKGEPAHWHYDFRYLLRAGALQGRRENDHESAWKPLQEVDEPHLKMLIVKLGDPEFSHQPGART
jgi:8-oxo-dGTP pyrophosphatase MutT (NUDIX family)